MVNYQLGKVYKIIGNGLLYVGSTTKLLCQRFSEHRYSYKSWLNCKGNYMSSFKCLIDPTCYIELLELCPCDGNDELRICENKWIQELNCVNQNNAVVIKTKTITKKKQELNNSEAISKQKQEYNQENIKETSKKNQELNNSEAVSKQKQKYKQENIEEIIKKKSNKFSYKCDVCNYTTTRDSQRKRHEMTPKHKLLIKQKSNEYNTNIYECGKRYAFASGLYLHEKTCTHLKNKSPEGYTNQIIMKLLKDNEEMKQIIIEQNKKQSQIFMQQQQQQTQIIIQQQQQQQHIIEMLLKIYIGNIQDNT